MRTKYQATEKDLPKLVKARVEGAMCPHDTSRSCGTSIKIGFKETIQWESRPTWHDPHWTKITFYGNTRFEQGFAEYEGPYGKWRVYLVGLTGPISKEKWQIAPCERTYGAPWCIEPSDEWHETPEQRKERIKRWIEEGVL
jgi:hypothetical protein